ncbi:integrase [Desulfosporosinus sp. Tol-M]|nr:integrase [Desulfosporosinus sp. Tol-M]
MDFPTDEQVAAFRYGLIAPIVSRQTPMIPGELKRQLVQIAALSHTIPGSHKTKVSVRTLERFMANYRKEGWEGLKPKKRPQKNAIALPAPVLQKAIELRRERPERSVEQIIYLLEHSGMATEGTLAPSTLSRHLRKAGVSRQELLQVMESSRGHRRFEVEDVHLMWQADFQHTLYLPDPLHSKKRKKAMLFAIIDDFSRAIVHGEFYWDEKLPRLEDALKKAILRHGVPSQFYCDNGSVFSSHHLVRICAKLNIKLSHSRPYKPQGRGKIERFFRFIDTSFRPEAHVQIGNGSITTLKQLNEAFTSWLEGYYHLRKHGSTGQSPNDRVAGLKRTMRRVSMAELTEIFLWEESRKVDKTGCVSVFGNTFEVPSHLSGQTVTLRFDPFDLSVMQVWYDGNRLPDARLLDLNRKVHERVKTKSKVEKQEAPPTTGLNFFKLAEQNRRNQWAQETLNFRPKQEVTHD